MRRISKGSVTNEQRSQRAKEPARLLTLFFDGSLAFSAAPLPLASRPAGATLYRMLSADLINTALALPVDDQLELVRRLVESAALPFPLSDDFVEGIRRVEAVAAGQATGLTEDEFRAALQ